MRRSASSGWTSSEHVQHHGVGHQDGVHGVGVELPPEVQQHEKILTLAKAIVRPAEEEEALLDALCTAAEAELAGRLREDVWPARAALRRSPGP